MVMTNHASRSLRSAALLVMFAVVCGAQVAPSVRTGNFEIGAFLGASHGVDKYRVMGGGNVSYALTKAVMPYVEFSYFPGIYRSQTVSVAGSGQATFNYSVPLADFHGGVHLRIPIKESRVVPYLVLGLGGLHSYARTEKVNLTLPTGNFSVDMPVPASTDFAVNFGGGLRYYATERFGVRVEAKAYRPTGSYTDVFYKIEGGIFFQIH